MSGAVVAASSLAVGGRLPGTTGLTTTVTRPVSLDLEFHGVTVDGYQTTRAGFSATGEILRSDFGIDFNAPLGMDGMLIGDKVTIDRYPHGWRSKKPVIFRATTQWFVAMEPESSTEADATYRLRERARVASWPGGAYCSRYVQGILNPRATRF